MLVYGYDLKEQEQGDLNGGREIHFLQKTPKKKNSENRAIGPAWTSEKTTEN